MKRPILATDLDRTLLPNGSWPPDPEAIELFNELTRAHDLLVVYVTGRNLALTESAIAEFGVRHPDVLCGDVGTTIRRWEAGSWREDPGWEARVRETSPAWDADTVRDAVAGIEGLREQEPEHINLFKQSYYADHARREEILTQVQRARGCPPREVFAQPLANLSITRIARAGSWQVDLVNHVA
jgi:hypothetical protein